MRSLLVYHGGLRALMAPCPCLQGIFSMSTPNAIDQMCSSVALVYAPRRQHPTTLHPLEAILPMTLLATSCGAPNWVESEPWGPAHHPWLSALADLAEDVIARDGQ